MLRWLRNKDGATLVLVAVMMLSAFGLMAVAVEVSRHFASRNQMQLAADAGAIAAAVAVIRGDTLAAPDSALVYALANHATAAAMSGDSAVVFGVWDAISLVFAPQATPSGANSIRVRAAQTSSNEIARIFGSASVTVYAGSIALFGGAVTETTCNRPIAVSAQLIDTNSDGVISQTEINQALAAGEMVIKPAESIDDAPSFYYAVVFPPFYDKSENTYITLSDSAKSHVAYEANLGGCNPDLVGVGDSILTKPGNMKGPTLSGLTAMCGEIVAELCNPSGVWASDGQPGIPIIAPLWDSRVSPLGRTGLEITDLAGFRVTRVTASGADVEVTGYFMRMTDSGAVAPGVGLLQRPILVR